MEFIFYFALKSVGSNGRAQRNRLRFIPVRNLHGQVGWNGRTKAVVFGSPIKLSFIFINILGVLFSYIL